MNISSIYRGKKRRKIEKEELVGQTNEVSKVREIVDAENCINSKVKISF